MRRLISSVFRAFDREPGPFLLGASAILVAVFWHLPVPPFLFAEGASGGSGGSSGVCQCSLNPCGNWGVSCHDCTSNPPPTPFESCDEDLDKLVECDGLPGLDKKMPASAWIYDKVDPPSYPGCSNTAFDDGTREVRWARRVNLDGTGEGNKKVEFKPKLRLTFAGFATINVCSGSVGQMKIDSGFYAAMQVCGAEWRTDPGMGTTGWAYATHYFQKSGSEWVVSGSGAMTPDFNISATCACGDESVEQEIHFATQVEQNTGVALGDIDSAYLVYSALDDATTCTKAP